MAWLYSQAPYAYLPLAAGREQPGGYSTPGAWGATHTVSGIITHILRKEYGTFRLFSGADRQGLTEKPSADRKPILRQFALAGVSESVSFLDVV